jgi:Tfp pilus assembly protein PilO
MASESMEKLARLALPAKAAILVVTIGLLGLVYYQLAYSDLVDERDGLLAVRSRQVEDEKRLNRRKAEYQELLRQKADVDERLRRNSIKLPESSELPAFFQHLETQASTANVRIVTRVIDKEVPVETYMKVPVRMEIQGDFYQLNNYFKLLSQTERIITIENLFIGDPRRSAERVTLTGKFTASTFRQADRAPSKQPARVEPAKTEPAKTEPGKAEAPNPAEAPKPAAEGTK